MAENTNVWADNLGIWHVTVPLTGNRRGDAITARTLIREALAEREGPRFDPNRVHVVCERVNKRTVQYRES